MNTTKTKRITLAMTAAALLGCNHLFASQSGAIDKTKCVTVTVSNFGIQGPKAKVLRCPITLQSGEKFTKGIATSKSRQVFKGWKPKAIAVNSETVDLRGMHQGALRNLRLVRAK